jgi:hypothetical protein
MDDDYIFWFDVSMEDLMGVQIRNSRKETLHDERDSLLTEYFWLAQKGVQLSMTTHFFNQVDILWITADPVEGDNVGVIDEGKNLDFSQQLSYQGFIRHILFGKNLESSNESCLFVPYHGDFAKFPCADLF